MLVLSRKSGEKILIGDDIVLTVIEIVGNRIRVGIDAPEDVCILRSELKPQVERDECWRSDASPSPKLSVAITGG